MAQLEHWTDSPEAAARLEQRYADALAAYNEAPDDSSRRRRDALAVDVRAAREHWRAMGEADGTRTFVNVEDGA